MIEVKDLTVAYNGKTVLGPISLSLPEKKFVGIVGPNGAGKSTLLKTVARVIEPDTGTVTVNEKNALHCSRADYAKTVSYLSQSRNLPDMTVERLVLHGRFPHVGYPRRYSSEDMRIAREAMCKAGIVDFADRPLVALSGGERQKAYIAMALAQDTQYILMDEPTVYLDVSCKISLMQTLRMLADSGKGIVAVLHDLPLALHFADKVVVLQDGKMVASDVPQQLCAENVLQKVFGADIARDEDGHYYYRY